LRDIDSRQRNVVFPDTLQNEGRFWRNLWASKESLSVAQWIGVLIMFFGLVACLAAYLRMLWPDIQEPSWQKVIDGYAVYIVVIGAAVAFIVVGNRRARRRGAKR